MVARRSADVQGVNRSPPFAARLTLWSSIGSTSAEDKKKARQQRIVRESSAVSASQFRNLRFRSTKRVVGWTSDEQDANCSEATSQRCRPSFDLFLVRSRLEQSVRHHTTSSRLFFRRPSGKVRKKKRANGSFLWPSSTLESRRKETNQRLRLQAPPPFC